MELRISRSAIDEATVMKAVMSTAFMTLRRSRRLLATFPEFDGARCRYLFWDLAFAGYSMVTWASPWIGIVIRCWNVPNVLCQIVTT